MEGAALERIKKEHIGKWVAIKDSETVAIADSHDDLYRVLREKRLDGVYVFYSPTERERGYGFLFGARAWR